MDAAKQKALRDYLIQAKTRLIVSPPRGRSAEQMIAHYAELNGRAVTILEHAIDELASSEH